MPKNAGDRWIAISYDGSFTGSEQHRQYNNGPNMLGRLRAQDDADFTPIGMYAKQYDIGGVKSKEPNFDGILAFVATLQDQVFDENFHYVRVEYKDEDQPDACYSGLSTCVLQPHQLGHRQDIAALVGQAYSDATHVFILGPMCPSIIADVEKLSGNVIFHFQGEPSCREGMSTTQYADGMVAVDGLFPVAFNFWTGEKEARVIRAMMDEKFTVKCNPTIVSSAVVAATIVGAAAEVTIGYPVIFQQINGWIYKHIYLRSDLAAAEPAVPLPTTPLTIVYIAEDLIDKDNSTACGILTSHSRTPPALRLIGRRVYDSDGTLFDFRKYNFKPPGARPPIGADQPPGTFVPGKPGGIPQPTVWPWMQPCVPREGRNTEIQFPALKPGSTTPPNQTFNLALTLTNHAALIHLFVGMLHASGFGNFKPIDATPEDIVDGGDGTSTSLRSPFHENLVFKGGIVGDAMSYAIDTVKPPAAAAAETGGRKRRNKRTKNKRTKQNRKRTRHH